MRTRRRAVSAFKNRKSNRLGRKIKDLMTENKQMKVTLLANKLLQSVNVEVEDASEDQEA